ncbi:MAG: RsmE family RNA methyltransferase [Desulforhopalus sp.]|jgi:RsmE family RNA methyltransferase|nr:RsmE family RNA methyltransferase [Desulforhopalus sp.]
MNIILAEDGEILGGSLCLIDRRAEHIVKVLRAEEGDRLRVGVVNGSSGQATITAIQKKYPFRVDLQVELTAPVAAIPPYDVILALPRPIMLRRVLSQLAALGVGTLHLVNAARVEKSFWKAGILSPEEYRPHLLQGLEQAVDTRLPEVVIHRRLETFLGKDFPGVNRTYSHRLIAHPEGSEDLGRILDDDQPGRLILAVGPEGGWLEEEVAAFVEQGFRICSLGTRILKVDTAVIALHARISALREIQISGRPRAR